MPDDTSHRVELRLDDSDARLAPIYERITESVGGIPNMYRALANAPGLLEGWLDFAWRLRSEPTSDRGLRELAILRVAILERSDYVWRSHWKLALRAGISEDKLRALPAWSSSRSFTDAERAVLALTDELVQSAAVADDTWAPFGSAFTDQEAVELVLTVAFYCCATRVAAGLGLPLEDSHLAVPSVDGIVGAAKEHE